MEASLRADRSPFVLPWKFCGDCAWNARINGILTSAAFQVILCVLTSSFYQSSCCTETPDRCPSTCLRLSFTVPPQCLRRWPGGLHSTPRSRATVSQHKSYDPICEARQWQADRSVFCIFEVKSCNLSPVMELDNGRLIPQSSTLNELLCGRYIALS